MIGARERLEEAIVSQTWHSWQEARNIADAFEKAVIEETIDRVSFLSVEDHLHTAYDVIKYLREGLQNGF